MHILTAAHCVYGLRATDITVYAGSVQERNGSQVLYVLAVTIHPNYSNTTYVNDIAILHLSVRLNMTDPNVGLISLPSSDSKEFFADQWPATRAEVSDLEIL